MHRKYLTKGPLPASRKDGEWQPGHYFWKACLFLYRQFLALPMMQRLGMAEFGDRGRPPSGHVLPGLGCLAFTEAIHLILFG
jgi:hypothetical protein